MLVLYLFLFQSGSGVAWILQYYCSFSSYDVTESQSWITRLLQYNLCSKPRPENYESERVSYCCSPQDLLDDEWDYLNERTFANPTGLASYWLAEKYKY